LYQRALLLALPRHHSQNKIGPDDTTIGSPLPGPRTAGAIPRRNFGVSQRHYLCHAGCATKEELPDESGVERLELRTGRDVKTAALELLLNSQVEFAEPNFLI